MAKSVHLAFRRVRPAYEKGRGARTNMSGRYEGEQRVRIDDGWGTADTAFTEGRKTDVTYETPRRIITYNTSPDLDFDRSINPYRGCEHGCIYCFARPTHAYMGLSPGLDFETRLFAKPDAAKLLARELSNPKYKVRHIAIGTNTDAYQPIERTHRIMRDILQVLSDFNHPVSILTKSDLITRDIDILAPMAAKGLARCALSITTQDRMLARSMEPRASTPGRRFEAIKALSAAGIPAGIMMGPIIPGLNDHELESLMEKGAEHGAVHTGYSTLRLPLEVSPLFQEWLAVYAPDRARRIMRHIHDINGGRDYDAALSRGPGHSSAYTKLLSNRYHRMAARLGLIMGDQRPALRRDLFRVPQSVSGQGDLFAGLD